MPLHPGGAQRGGGHRHRLRRVVQVDPIKPTLKATGSERLKLKYDEPLSNFAFNFNLRPYASGKSVCYNAPVLEAGAYTRPLFSSTHALSVG